MPRGSEDGEKEKRNRGRQASSTHRRLIVDRRQTWADPSGLFPEKRPTQAPHELWVVRLVRLGVSLRSMHAGWRHMHPTLSVRRALTAEVLSRMALRMRATSLDLTSTSLRPRSDPRSTLARSRTTNANRSSSVETSAGASSSVSRISALFRSVATERADSLFYSKETLISFQSIRRDGEKFT